MLTREVLSWCIRVSILIAIAAVEYECIFWRMLHSISYSLANGRAYFYCGAVVSSNRYTRKCLEI